MNQKDQKNRYEDIDLDDDREEIGEDPGVILPDHSELPATVSREGKHDWKQEGNQVVCRACPSDHGYFIGMDKIIVGKDAQGNPVLANRP